MVNNHWKNCPPEETIEKITKALREFDIELQIEWSKDMNPMNIYSNFVRAFDQPPTMKSAGKGITPLYSQASGYAEFIERFQTFMMFYREYSRSYFKDEKVNVQYNECEYPYLDLLTGQPRVMSSAICYSTGMASGNTDKEAIVHAICEVVERQTLMDFCYGDVVVNSKIPKTAFKFPFYELEERINGKVQLFDIGRFGIPTVALVCRNELTRQLVFHIDTAPTLELAVERCLTEFFQNNNFDDSMRYFYWQGDCETDGDTLYGILMDYHLGPVPGSKIKLLEDAPVRERIIEYNFTEDSLIQQFIKGCKEIYNYSGVYLRDFKWAGFPTVYIYVPDLIKKEHPNITWSKVYSNIFTYFIEEYDAYDGTAYYLLEALAKELMEMYFGKPDPILIMKRQRALNIRNPYATATSEMLAKMRQKTLDFEMDISYFKTLLNI